MPKVTGRTGNPALAVRVQPIVPIATATKLGDTLQVWQFPQPNQKEYDEDHQARPSKAAGVANATATKKIATGKEVASAQAIERGHPVVMIEVPDHEDDTSFRLQQNKVTATDAGACGPSPKRKSPLQEREAEHPIGNDTLTEWTWRAIKDAKDESTARAILLNWIHKTRAEEVVDNLLEGLRSSERFRALDWLDELRKPKRYFIRAQNSPSSLLLPVILETLEGPISIQSKALVDSGCTGSSIHHDFVKKHGIPIRKMASPIPVYNADGSRNKAGEITAYAELRLKVGDHSEKTDLAVTDLGSKEIFLGHDWLARHNPIINWATGRVTFTRCHCIKNRFVLPDADPDDEWELEEGETILSIDFEEAIEIHAIHKANELAAKANEGKERKTFEQMVPEPYRDFEDLFAKENFDDLPIRKPWDHAIELILNAKNTLDCKVYPLNPIEQKELDKFLDENLASGRIKPSKSPMASPFFFVKKKDGTLRPVQDYCKLNEMTIKNRYPLLLISELMDKLGSAKYFTKLDVRWGYNNVRIKKDDKWKAAFRTNRGLFEPTIMFFGLTNSPATFQWMMNDIFKDLIATGKVTVYLDDILIFSKTLEEHRKITRRVLELLRKHKLFLKAEKCEFEVLETEYLGVIISEGSIRMDPVKLAGIAEWPIPTKKKELQSFLGFANFYRRFIKGYSDIVCPMTCLTGKEVWTWGTAQQIAFQRLKNQFAIDVILRIPTEKGQFRVEADASEGAIGAVLSQEQDGKWRPVAFLSKALTITERNYEIYDKELLAIMLALDKWRHYLMGATVDFEIWTDHQNLQYFRKPQKLNRRQARWVTELAEYHFTLHHKPGASNKKADLLSRRADHPQGQDDNDEIIVLSPEHFQAMIMPTTDETHERIKSATRTHQKWDQGIANSLNHEKGIKEKDGLLYYDKRIYVPRDSATRGEIISCCHDHITAGHPGIEKTKELVLRDYWWPKLKKDVEAYVQGCETCARAKASTQARRAPLHPNEIPSEPWTHISVDMITGLVPCKGLDAMLVIVDRFSKAIIPIACKTTLSSEGWAKILHDEVYAKYGMPVTVISDRGPQFVSKFLQDLYKMLDIKGNTSTAFHPQTDGQTERANQEIEKYLRIFINFQQTDWPEWLLLAAFQHNNCIHSATGKSPFFVNYGRNPRVAPDSHSHAPLRMPASEAFKTTMKRIHDETKTTLEKAAVQMKNQYDKKKKAAVEYQTGDKVWLDTTNLHLARPKKKLDDKHVGPFLVLEKHGLSAYKLKLLATWKIYPVFNETLLTPYVAPTFANQKQNPPPPPDIINDEEQYEIDTILDHKLRKVHGAKDPKTGKYTTKTVTDYLVAWKGYGKEENQWTKESELGYAKEAIAEYWENKEDTITIQAAVTNASKADGSHAAIFILDSRQKDGQVQFQVQQGTNFVTTAWYFEHEIPHLSELIKDYYWASREEFATLEALSDSTAGAFKGSPSAIDNHPTSSNPLWCVKVPGDKPPIIVVPIITASIEPQPDGAWEPGPNLPCEVSSQDEQAAPREENTARNPKDDPNVTGATTLSSTFPQGIMLIAPSDAPMPKVTGWIGNSMFAVQIQPVISTAIAVPRGDTLQVRQFPHPEQKERDEDHQKRLSKATGVANAMATKKIAAGKEVASTQAIEREHLVVMIKVPDEDDDTSFRLQQNKVAATDADTCRPSPKRESPLQEREAEHPIGNDTSVSEGQEAAKHMPLMGTPQEWLKPFETKWTWRAIKDTKDESAARAILLNWIHKTQAEEVIDNLLKGLHSSERFRALDWLDELRKPKRYFIHAQNSPTSLLLPVVLETLG
ncbi:uncharacterized protein ARMOST_16979 [Armillaria ostoyae]|uniref:RNA-directed DNA polymerase n=1 Tax=Armillaria ostoyae TaxID=47428 RepID=A0A284RXQ2_ARMOS|nr:uncharacterized protein ARMOST_16979 [Armillaria ostoyae]